MELTRAERWILSNQFTILSTLDEKNREFYDNTREIIERGYEGLYDTCSAYIYSDDETLSEEESKEVFDILDMFSAITRSLETIEDKSVIDVSMLKFSGFDGNTEGVYMAFARFYCTEYQGGNQYTGVKRVKLLLFHPYQTLETYRRMLEAWNSCEEKRNLTRDDLVNIATASIHPSNR